MHRAANMPFGRPLLTFLVLAAGAVAAPAPEQPRAGILILDNCDGEFRGKARYENNLSSLDSFGKLVFRVSGFNGCECIGSNHMIATDPARDCAWVLEIVANRVRKFDRAGKELLVIKDVKASSLAVDPETGNLWVLTSGGGIRGERTVVFDPKGLQLATYSVGGWDIAYDKKGKSFWIAGQKLTKISADKGEVAFSADVAVWSASSVTVHAATGRAWVAVRQHPQVAGSKNELLAFDADGTQKHAIELGDLDPFHVCVEPKSGAVWVTLLGKSVRRYSAEGKLQAEHEQEALAAQVDTGSGALWVVTPNAALRLGPKGEVLKRVEHKGRTSQAWVAGW
jgi:DNA-binding beta-propeller fold protein YncE